MANIYVWAGTGGTPGSPWGGWDTAAATLATAYNFASAGDIVYVAHDHTETTSGITLSGSGSPGLSSNPVKILCGTRSGTSGDTGVSALATTGVVKSSSTTFTVTGGSFYMYGLTLEQTSTSSTAFRLAEVVGSTITYENCTFIMSGNNAGTRLYTGYSGSGTTHPAVFIKNCSVKFGGSGQRIGAGSTTVIDGLTLISGTGVATLFALGADSRGCNLQVNGLDLTNASTTMDLCEPGGTTQFARIRNAKMPASWTGDIHSAAPTGGGARYELLNYTVGSSDVNYRFWTSDSKGQTKENIAIYRNSGASDGTTPYCIEMISTANVAWPDACLRSMPIIRRVAENPGVSTAVTIHITHDNATALTDREIWVELEYLGSAGLPLSLNASDRCAILTAAASQDTSSETWTGTGGFSNAKQLKLVVSGLSFETSGYLIATVCYAKASTTVYVDPKIELS